jgi:hypothetical protein
MGSVVEVQIKPFEDDAIPSNRDIRYEMAGGESSVIVEINDPDVYPPLDEPITGPVFMGGDWDAIENWRINGPNSRVPDFDEFAIIKHGDVTAIGTIVGASIEGTITCASLTLRGRAQDIGFGKAVIKGVYCYTDIVADTIIFGTGCGNVGHDILDSRLPTTVQARHIEFNSLSFNQGRIEGAETRSELKPVASLSLNDLRDPEIIFKKKSTQSGVVDGNVTFKDGSLIYGVVIGFCRIEGKCETAYSTSIGGVTIISGTTVYNGTIWGYGSFEENSVNAGKIWGDGIHRTQFKDTASNTGRVDRAEFSGESKNEGSVVLDSAFLDQSENYGLLHGNVDFYDDSVNRGKLIPWDIYHPNLVVARATVNLYDNAINYGLLWASDVILHDDAKNLEFARVDNLTALGNSRNSAGFNSGEFYGSSVNISTGEFIDRAGYSNPEEYQAYIDSIINPPPNPDAPIHISTNEDCFGKGGKGGKGGLGGIGQSVDNDYSMDGILNDISVSISAGAGDAFVTFTW